MFELSDAIVILTVFGISYYFHSANMRLMRYEHAKRILVLENIGAYVNQLAQHLADGEEVFRRVNCIYDSFMVMDEPSEPNKVVETPTVPVEPKNEADGTSTVPVEAPEHVKTPAVSVEAQHEDILPNESESDEDDWLKDTNKLTQSEEIDILNGFRKFEGKSLDELVTYASEQCYDLRILSLDGQTMNANEPYDEDTIGISVVFRNDVKYVSKILDVGGVKI